MKNLYGTRILQDGDTGDDVKDLQIKIVMFGSTGKPVPCNGTFCANTKDAVIKFRKEFDLAEKEIVDSEMFEAIDKWAESSRDTMQKIIEKYKCNHSNVTGSDKTNCDKLWNDHVSGKLALNAGGTAGNTSTCTGFGNNLSKVALTKSKKYEFRYNQDTIERPGIDKILYWMIMGMLKIYDISTLQINNGYRCNYKYFYIQKEWGPAALTNHTGHAIDFLIPGSDITRPNGEKLTSKSSKATHCNEIRDDLKTFGVSETFDSSTKNRPRSEPRARDNGTIRKWVHLDTTVYEHHEYIQSVDSAILPMSAGMSNGYSLPVDIKDVDTTQEVTKEFINKYYTHNEQEFEGGYFPVGGNTSWHSGVHIIADDGAPVRAVADGEIICARMPVADPNQDKLTYGSRNFVMIKHNTNEKIWYSVYYHLKSTSFDSEEAKEVVWWKSKSLKVTKNRNLRVIPGDKKEDIIRTIDTKNGPVTCEILDLDGDWIEVQDPETDRVGFVLFASDRMEIIDSVSQHYKDCFSEGDHVVQINENVSAGDIIGYVGEGIVLEDKKPSKKPLLHWTILSNELFDPNWLQVSDTDDDYTCNSKVLVKLVDKNDDEKITVPEVIEYYGNEENAKKIRPYACKFTSEWAVDWKKFASKMKAEGVRAVPATLQMYNFWKDAADCDSDVLKDGSVWHYNPITFLEKLLFATTRATFSELFEPDKTFPLPTKLKKLGKKIGNYLSGATIKYVHFILHSGVEGDTLDAKELSQKRAEIIEGYFKPSVDFFKKHIGKDKEWGDRERKIMMSYLKNPDGKSYGLFPANDDPVDDKFKEIVRAYQEDYSLGVDGDFGKGSLTKAVELLLEEIGMNELPEIVVTVAGDNHKEESESQGSEDSNNSESNESSQEDNSEDAAPSKIMEVILWKDEIEPAVDQYEGDAAGVYEKWQSVINLELEDALTNAQFGIELYRPDDAKLKDDKFECVVDGGSKFKMNINNNGSPAILTVKGMKVSNDSLITLIRYPAEKLEAQYIFKDIPYSALTGDDPDIGYFENEESEGENNETTA